ncbi:uncharacterized protein LOC125578211 [Brassica napus]|uniref:uncharacterized protein LOC125578211 n=1 Tax=Brassica napus TaxID=3708 RepID=UPI0020786069|nr:uncharacterized protein LOC125578211 [Brassica napus]
MDTKLKEGGGTSIKCPMLTATNYTVWEIRMKIALKVHKVWEAVEEEEPNGDKNNMAIALLFQSIPEVLILQVGELNTAKKVWEAIKTRHVGAERVKEARLQTLMSEFERLKMKDTEKIDDFSGKLSEIASKFAELVKKFLTSLPRKKFIHIVASLEQVLDRNNTKFEDIIGRLKAYEEHCPDRLLKLQETQENDNTDTQDADELMMHEVVYLNEKNCNPEKYETHTDTADIWYLDNGASNHMTGDQRYFSVLDNTVTGKVRFGDDSKIDIKGKGTISFTDMNGEARRMNDVYFIPNLRSNIISLGQATESGCDIRLKDDYLTMSDQQGKLLVTAKRSKK